MSRGNLLLIDDDRHVLDSMAAWLRDQGYRVETAADRTAALGIIGRKPLDIVLCDVRLRDADGFEILQHCRKTHPEISVIMLSGYGSVEMAMEAIRAGAFDFLTKPLIDQELDMAIQRALNQGRVLAENQILKKQLDQRFSLENVVGRDHRMQRVYEMIDSVADTKATVLITGESGTGKSLIARALHRRSSRKNKPFVEVACGALPETLLESELFGHTAGSFTGANHDKVGKFAHADTGTIFLDEIGTATPGLQVKLLRVLQEFEFEPVGGNKTIRVDTRVILATNEILTEAVASGKFRQDLFYRINVINIELPNLRERANDIPLLAEHFLQKVSKDTGKKVRGFHEEALTILQRYNWPGNVRELQNVIERAVLLGKSELITPADLPPQLMALPSHGMAARAIPGSSLKEALMEPERQIIMDVLEINSWNRNLTADQLGINRTTLYKKMKKLGLDESKLVD